jgi:Gametolysin peptidase M11
VIRAVVLLFLGLFGLAPAASAPAVHNNGRTGDQPTIVIRATWGPEPYSETQVRQVVFGETSDYIREASYGQTWLSGDVTPWLKIFPSALKCRDSLDEQAPLDAATRAGFNLPTYSRIVVVTPLPPGDCLGAGLEAGTTVWLFGYLDRRVLAHELGHGFGLNHAWSWNCSGSCRSIEYGDPYDEMGHGDGHFNAFEKVQTGWLPESAAPRARNDGEYVIDQLERGSDLPRALVVDTAYTEYWFDHRERIGLDDDVVGSADAKGIHVHTNLEPGFEAALHSRYPVPNTILLDPAGRGRPAVVPGETFKVPGAFELDVVEHVGTQVRVHFRWTDTTRPTIGAVVKPAKRAGSTTRVEWRTGRDAGSGVDRYDISIDGKLRVRVSPEDYVDNGGTTLRRLARGRHTVAVVAVDRAGNRSRPARRTFTVR